MADDYSGIASEATAPSDYSSFASPVQKTGGANPYEGIAIPKNAQPGVTVQGIKQGGIITDPDSGGIVGTLHRLGQTIEGSAAGSALQGFSGWAARTIDKLDGYAGAPWSTAQINQDHPGQDPELTKSIQADYERKAMLDLRQKAANQVAANSQGFNPAGFVGSVAGSVDPTWAINPAEGLVKNLAVTGAARVGAKVVANAGAHAVMGSADDAAYQIADQLDGLQKTFDIKRNLEAAMTQGAFGAAHVGITEAAPHVSDFVTNLFKERGTDTLPPDRPQGLTKPLTGQPLTPEETAQYHEILQTGDEHDIRGFFDGRNQAPPSFEDAHEWVKRRDAVNDGIAPSDYADDMFKPVPEQVDPRPAVQEHIDNETANWKNKPDFEVINHVDDIQDPAVKQQAINEGADHPDALGFLGPDGKVRIFANRINSPEMLNAVIYHEALGHYGLAQQFGDKLDSTIQTLLDRNVGQFSKDVDAYQKENPGAYNGDRVRAAEEVLANQSNNGVIKPSVADALVAHVRNFGRKMGLKLNYSDGEINTILGMAHDAVINGKGRDVVANGFRSEGARPQKAPVAAPEGVPQPAEQSNQPQVPEQVSEPSQAEQPIVHQIIGTNKFIRRSDLEPKDIAEEAFERLGQNYEPKIRSWDDAKAAAKDTPLDYRKVMAARSVGNLDKKLFQYSAAAEQANEVLTSLAKKAETEGLTHDEHVLGMETAAHFNYVLGRLDNDASQIARGLNALKAIRLRRNSLVGLRQALEESGTNMEALADPETMNKFLFNFNNLLSKGNPAGAAALVKGVTQPYWWEYLLTWHNNMMLSGMSTHLKSAMDQLTTKGRDMEEQVAALGAVPVRALMQSLGLKVQDGIHPTEIGMHVWGMSKAVLDASTWRDAADAFVHGRPIQRLGPSNRGQARIPIVSKVGDAIAAADTLFRAVFTNGNLYALGTRQAAKELKAAGIKHSWDDITTLGSNYARNPTREMLKDAVEQSEQTMLMNRSELNNAIDNAKAIRPGMNGTEQLQKAALGYMLPFIRVQSNALMNQIVRRSPLSFLDPVTRADFKEGGARRDVAIMRTLIGSAILVNAWNAAAPDKDRLTSEGPDNANKLKELKASGWAPNSVHENGRYNQNSNLNISLNPFDLHNNTVSLVAGIRHAYDDGISTGKWDMGFKLAFAAVMHDLTSQTFTKDLGEKYEDVKDQGIKGWNKLAKLGQDELASNLPNQGKQIAHIVDPNQHDVQPTLAGAVENSIPGLTDKSPIKYSVYGQPLKTGTTLSGIHTWLSHGNGQEETKDPTEMELGRLGKLTPAAVVTPVQKTIKIDGASVKLEPDQFEEYQKYAGQTLTQAVKEQMDSGEWAKMSDAERIMEVRSIQKDAKSQVKEALLGKEGWLKPDQLDSLRKQLNGK